MNLIKKIVIMILSLPNSINNSFLLWYRNVSFAKRPKINGKIAIFGRGQINIGENVTINSSRASNPIGGDTKTMFSVDNGAILEIGNNTGLSNISVVCKKKIKIGENVRIGGSTKIYDSDFHSIILADRISIGNDIPIKKAVEIKNGAFIGAFSIILKGVTIGEESIIGAGSVVTKSVPDREIWAGNPAKFIKRIGE